MKSQMTKAVIILAALWPLAAPAQADITSNLIVWLKLEDGSGSTATDSSGNGHNGTLNNSPTWITPGKIGSGALSFAEGSAGSIHDYVDMGSALVPATSDSTVSCWARFTTQSTSGSSRRPFVTQGVDFHFGAQRGPTTTVVFTRGNGQITTSSSYADSAWHHYALVYSAGTNACYVDGTSVGTFSNSTDISGTNTAIGFDLSPGQSTRDFAGDIDDFRIYSRALTSDDIRQLYFYPSALRALHHHKQEL